MDADKRMDVARRKTRSIWERLAAATGIVFVILSIAAALIGGQVGTRDVVDFFVERRTPLLIQSYLFGLASVFFLWFLGSLRGYLGRAEGNGRRLSTVAFAGGIMTLVLLLIAGVIQTALAEGIAELSDPGISRALYALVVIASDLTNFPTVAFAAATGLVILRTNALPKWLGWLSLVVGINGLIRGIAVVVDTGPLSSTGAYENISVMMFLIWLLLLSIFLVLRVGAARADR